MPRHWNFASVADTRTRLERAGFEVEPSVWLESARSSRPTPRAFARAVAPRQAHRAAARRAPRGVRRRGPRLDAAPAACSNTYASTSRRGGRDDAQVSSLLPGDGIGPEIVGAARRVSTRSATSTTTSTWSAVPRSTPTATPLTDDVLDACRAADAVLLGAVGGPEVGHDRPRRARGPSRGCSGCARASACSPTCARSSRSRRCSTRARCGRERIAGTDLLVVRELTGGIYFGEKTAHRDQRQRHLRLHHRGDRADRPGRLRGGPPRAAGG